MVNKIKKIIDVTESKKGDVIEYTHPSYGLISFSRCSCTSKNLFGSNIKHNSFITLRIDGARATKGDDLHRDYINYNFDRYIEVGLTSSQFAELLTTMNIGEGIPCTISYMKGLGMIEYNPPYVESLDERSKRMLDIECQRNAKHMKELKASIDKILEKKGALTKEEKHNLSHLMNRFIDLSANGMSFAEKSFEEEAERQKQKIKTEIDATLALMKEKITIPSEYKEELEQ